MDRKRKSLKAKIRSARAKRKGKKQLLIEYRRAYFANPNSQKFIALKRELDDREIPMKERNKALWMGPI